MKLLKLLGSLSAAALLLSCVATAPKLNVYDAQAVGNAVSVKRDDFQKTVDYNGPNIAPGFGGILRIRAWKFEKTSEVKYQIYIADYYDGEWRFYNSAYDSNGESLDTTLISRKVDSCSRYGCSHTEHVGLNITKEYLEKNKDSGINFKLSGKAGEAIFFIPGTYVQAILSVVNGTPIQQSSTNDAGIVGKTSGTNGTPKERFTKVLEKIRAVCALEELKEYYSKTGCLSNEITLKQMTDETKVTAEQKPVILKTREMIDVLNKELDTVLNSIGPDKQREARIRNEFYSVSDNIHLDLYSEKISWGEFNRRRKDMVKQIEERLKIGR